MDDEREIRNLVDTWMTATKAGDAKTVLGLMTDDVVFLVSGQAPFGKSAFAEASEAQSGAPVTFDGKSEILEIKVLGDWAYTLTKLRFLLPKPARSPWCAPATRSQFCGKMPGSGELPVMQICLSRSMHPKVAPNNSFKAMPLRDPFHSGARSHGKP